MSANQQGLTAGQLSGATTPNGTPLTSAGSKTSTANLFGTLDSTSAALFAANLQQQANSATLSGHSAHSAYHLFDPANLNENIYNLSQFNVSLLNWVELARIRLIYKC